MRLILALDDFGAATSDEIDGLIGIRVHVVPLSGKNHLDHSHVLVIRVKRCSDPVNCRSGRRKVWSQFFVLVFQRTGGLAK